MMTRLDIEGSIKSIIHAKRMIELGLIQPEEASQLWRMIAYEEDRIKQAERELEEMERTSAHEWDERKGMERI